MPHTPGASDKKILLAFLFAFFIGAFGIHRFYVGKKGTGIVMIILTVTIIGLIASCIWAIIDWVMIVSGNFKDKDGKTLKDWN